jgi:hypothetical protein
MNHDPEYRGQAPSSQPGGRTEPRLRPRLTSRRATAFLARASGLRPGGQLFVKESGEVLARAQRTQRKQRKIGALLSSAPLAPFAPWRDVLLPSPHREPSVTLGLAVRRSTAFFARASPLAAA